MWVGGGANLNRTDERFDHHPKSSQSLLWRVKSSPAFWIIGFRWKQTPLRLAPFVSAKALSSHASGLARIEVID